MVVVRYGDPVSVNCTATRTTRGMGWEATVGSTGMQPNSTQSLLWNVSSLTDWTAEPKCYANFQTEPKQCEKKLNVTLYKYPDRVSVSSNTSVMDAGRPYRLQCDVQSIAPVQYLSVNWYRGGALIHTKNFTRNSTRTPVNVSPTLLITPSCTDDGVQYTCEAELRLGPDGPQPNQSEPLNITIHHMKTDVQSLLWSVSSLTDWTAEPKCYANFQTEPKQCVKKLDITLYKLPDSVSIRPIPGKKTQEWNQTELHCDVVNVAPARFLTLKWLKGETLVQEKLFNDITEKDPRNITETLLITLSRSDDGVQYTCVSELRLGPGGPQPNPVMKSEPLSIIVLPCEFILFELTLHQYGGSSCVAGETHIFPHTHPLCSHLLKQLQCIIYKENTFLYYFPAAATDCLIEIDPKRVVVKYGDPVSVNCTATRTTRGMGWEASVGSTGLQPNSTQTLLWSVSNMTDWTAEPKCYANFQTEPKQCEKKLNISLYKYPDSVSISSVGHTGPVEEGRQYLLQCDVQSIAPVQYLSVNWYRGGALIHTETFTEDTTRTPVNVSRTLLITPNRTDDRVQYSCEAELRLEPEGPQPNPIMKSGPLNVTMLCELLFILLNLLNRMSATLHLSPGYQCGCS
ncbi:ICAM1 protein, partial [Amia calva]|nr:ICAM1 protein [Amia calva]